jgi:hypothetical protein
MNMNIEFTKDQYKTLLKLMYCGEWVLNSHKTGEDKVSRETDKFEQYIFSFAKEFKLEKWIENDDADKKYFPSASMEETFHKYIDVYNNRQRKL